MAYSQQQKDKIFETVFTEIINGRAVRNILKDEGMPNATTFFEWLSQDEEKNKQYARACELRAEALFDEILEIADDKSQDVEYTENGQTQNSEFIQRSRVRIDARKWVASKLNPKKFGDKVDVTTQGEKINQPQAIQIEIVKADEAKGDASISE